MGVNCSKSPYSRRRTVTISRSDGEDSTDSSCAATMDDRELPGGCIHKGEHVLMNIQQSDINGNGSLNNNNNQMCDETSSSNRNGLPYTFQRIETKLDLMNNANSNQLYTDCHPESDESSNRTANTSSVKMWFLKRGTTFKKKIGEGSYSTVFLASDKSTKGLVAIKVMDLLGSRRQSTESKKLSVQREMQIMCSLRHSHVIRVLQRPVKLYGRFLCMMLELAEQDLLDYIQKKGYLSEQESRRLFSQLMNALSYSHGRGIAHRDLKCENILLNDQPDVKLSDFGMARKCYNEEEQRPDMCKTYCGSTTYIAPEVLKRRPYDAFKADVWSSGVVLFAMVSGSMPFENDVPQRLIAKQLDRDWQLPEHSRRKLSSECVQLLTELLEPTVGLRPTVTQVLNNQWLR